MEEWTWPPRYDADYLPPAGQEYWFPIRETMDDEQRNAALLIRIRAVMEYAAKHSAFYREKWHAAGVEPEMITSLEAFEAVPPVTKEELRAEQAAHEPFGRYLCIDEDDVFHIHGTSGTTGRPTAFGIGRSDWRSIANAHARVMWSMGIRPSDSIFIGSFFSLYMGSWGALIGAERIGARVFPFGAGVSGQTARSAHWLRQMRPSVFYGTPSYALHLAEVAASEGIDPKEFGTRILFFSGEPGASVPSVRSKIEDAYGAEVFDSGSMAEVSPWMALGETREHDGMLCWQDLVYTEVADPTTYRRVPYGSEGTPIYTTLERTSQPMIRLLSNDLTCWEAGPSACGRTYPRLPRGIYGRIDDMFTIRGENIYPSAIDDVLTNDLDYGGEHRIVVDRSQTMDKLFVEVEYNAAIAGAGPTTVTDWAANLAYRLRIVLGIGVHVIPVPRGTFERTEFKARRVIDDREELRRVASNG